MRAGGSVLQVASGQLPFIHEYRQRGAPAPQVIFMAWNRFIAVIGASLAVVAALVMLLWGGAVVRTLSSLTQPAPHVVRELNLVGLAAMGLGLGLALMIYGLGQARRQFRIEWLARVGLVLGGLLAVVGSTMLFAALDYVGDRFAELSAQPDSLTPENVARLISSGVQRSTLAAFTLLLAVSLLTIGTWKLLWTDPAEMDDRRTNFWISVLTLGILSATTFAILYQMATGAGRAAMAAAQDAAAPATLAGRLANALTYSQAAATCLAVASLAVLFIGLGFRKMIEPE